MRVPNAVLIIGLALSVTATSYAQRVLDSDETNGILRELTSRNRTTWIAAGVIEGTHQAYKAPVTTDSDSIESQIQQEIVDFEADPGEILRSEKLQEMHLAAIPFNVRYRLANESTTVSDEVVKYDGQRFYWGIDVVSRSDSVGPTSDLIDNYMTDGFDLTWNERRVFTWDGANYTIYSASGQYATVDADNRVPHSVNGPLTAGFIAWGRGDLTYDNLSKADVSATEIDREGTTQIQLIIDETDGTSDEFFLIPSMNYAVANCTLERSDDIVTTIYYDGYEKVGDNWVPSSILIEERDAFSERLLRSHKWEIKVTDTSTPSFDAFKADFYDNTIVEYCSSVDEKPSLYYYSNATDTAAMLGQHLTYVAREGRQKQNCATAALKYAASQLGVSIPDSTLAALVNARGQTSLHDLKQCAEDLGLYCRPLMTHLSTLEDLSDCRILLVRPNEEHLVVVDHIDSTQAWVVDLTHEKFYYPQNLQSIGGKSTIMLLSRRPVVAQAQGHTGLSLATTVGELPYSCTELLQEEAYDPCGDGCIGIFTWYFERWGCEPAPFGTCTWQTLASRASVQCYDPTGDKCQPLGDWYYSYMPACE